MTSTPDQETSAVPSDAVTRPLMFEVPRVIVVIPSLSVTQMPTVLHDTVIVLSLSAAVIVVRRRIDVVSLHEGQTSISKVPALSIIIAKAADVTPAVVLGWAWVPPIQLK